MVSEDEVKTKMENQPCNVLTIATGKRLYLDLAVNLARSFFCWNSVNDINFYLVTDCKEFLPADLKDRIKLVEVKQGELGEGFSPKLYLDEIIPEGNTLFIDSDCLVYGDLSTVFLKFRDHAVSVIGTYISDEEWFGDIKSICNRFNVSRLPKFNGGVYYIEKGEQSKQVYTTARRLEKEYDEIGFVRLRNRPNDEVIMALAMQLHEQQPIAEDGSIMAEFVNFQTGVVSDVLRGKAILYNTPGNKYYNARWPLREAHPLIVHYLGHHNRVHPYISEERKLLYAFAKKYPHWLAQIMASIGVTLPWQIKAAFKNTFRPIYRTLFGARRIQKSERVIE